ncbi:pyridoxine/pyridoxamine 5'-phosphate oxidase [Salinisphaera hydrothermalis]|uniref:Pyridoxamine 5'-phosphate oxidase n=2 Tax=Salinisphaera TaxID=180541 RepID=A0A084IPW4_SALHC|nr:pyridoxamine 5'-phosphate oxidase [Salinisphaera hydrothermalis C41B8]
MTEINAGSWRLRQDRPKAQRNGPIMHNAPPDDPLKELARVIEHAYEAGEIEPLAATLATVDSALNRPSARTVYVHLLPDGIGLFVNTFSGKGRQLLWNPYAALCFYWRKIEQQTIVEGPCEVLDAATADRLWRKRPRESTLVAQALDSTDPLDSDQELSERIAVTRQRYSFEHPPRPEHWQGYRLIPERVEFWTTGWDRARHRRIYERDDSGWRAMRQPP